MRKKVFQLLVDNTSGVLSRISGLYRRCNGGSKVYEDHDCSVGRR